MKSVNSFRQKGTPPASMTPRASVASNRASAKPVASHTGGPGVNTFRVNTNKSVAKD